MSLAPLPAWVARANAEQAERDAKAPAKTNAERQREFRARKVTEQQATEVRGIFAHPDDHAEVKEAAAKIARRRQRAAKHSGMKR